MYHLCHIRISTDNTKCKILSSNKCIFSKTQIVNYYGIFELNYPCIFYFIFIHYQDITNSYIMSRKQGWNGNQSQKEKLWINSSRTNLYKAWKVQVSLCLECVGKRINRSLCTRISNTWYVLLTSENWYRNTLNIIFPL